MESSSKVMIQDYFPAMVSKLGGEGFVKVLCEGFRLLMDGEKGLITFESLKKNSAFLGLESLSDDEVMCMVKEGDFDGDGGLNEMEFCALMVRSSPGLMRISREFLEGYVL